ncbi:hypothetical protein B0H19DRAFT_1201916 [Mycena capillaripes]|nr:hypothetical protein B0H19DRAFT_1201916 [Mycena capillaripes]
MSVEELQARIDHFSAEIERQREVLKQLESSKSAVQRQLNALRDPIARLPLEISSEIFLRCLSGSPTPDAEIAPTLLLNVCNSWSHIALSTPTLWNAIHMEGSGAEILGVWLQRAGNYALTISLRGSLDCGVATILGQYAGQLKHLEIYEKYLRLDPIILTSLGSLPCLETMTIAAVGDSRAIHRFSLAQTIGLVRLAPNLVQCTFHDVFTNSDYTSTEDLVLPALRCLTFGKLTPDSELHSISQDDLLRHFSLPSLETLALPFDSISTKDFSLFLKRSSPPLQKLILGGGFEIFSSAELEEWLRFIPSVSYLQLRARRTPVVDGLFSTLADPASRTLLPNLHTLKIQYDSPPLSSSSYRTLLRALSVRRAPLVCLDLRSLYARHTDIESDVYNELRQLAAEGMDIHIGTNHSNFLSL